MTKEELVETLNFYKTRIKSSHYLASFVDHMYYLYVLENGETEIRYLFRPTANADLAKDGRAMTYENASVVLQKYKHIMKKIEEHETLYPKKPLSKYKIKKEKLRLERFKQLVASHLIRQEIE